MLRAAQLAPPIWRRPGKERRLTARTDWAGGAGDLSAPVGWYQLKLMKSLEFVPWEYESSAPPAPGGEGAGGA